MASFHLSHVISSHLIPSQCLRSFHPSTSHVTSTIPAPPTRTRRSKDSFDPTALNPSSGVSFTSITDAPFDYRPLPNDPNPQDIEQLRRQYGFIDPTSPEFRFHKSNSGASKILTFTFIVFGSLGLYHFSTTVRDLVNSAIEALQAASDNNDAKKDNEKSKNNNSKSGKNRSILEEVKAEGKPNDVKPPAAAAAASPAISPQAQKLLAARKLAQSTELLALIELNEQCKALLEIERLEQSKSKFNKQVDALANVAGVIVSGELPASATIRAVKEFVTRLELPPLPTPPKWSNPPTSIEEAKTRLEAIANFRAEYETAITKAACQLRNKMGDELQPALQQLFDDAQKQFELELPERLRRAKVATSNALEASALIEVAEVSRAVASEKAKEWSYILAAELSKQKKQLESAMRDVLSKQERALDDEYTPDVEKQLQSLAAQRADIARIEKELGRKKQIEKTGERVHALTSLLIKMEENLQRDTKAKLFDENGAVQQPTPPAWASELQQNWSHMLALSKDDPRLNRLLSSIPTSQISASSLASPSLLRHTFVDVEKAIREATFLPPGEEIQTETSIAAVAYAKAFSALTLREGQELRPAITDADRLNNATFYLYKDRNLAAAVRELDSLQSPKARAEAQEWLDRAKQRVHVEATVWKIRQNIQQTAKNYAKNTQ